MWDRQMDGQTDGQSETNIPKKKLLCYVYINPQWYADVDKSVLVVVIVTGWIQLDHMICQIVWYRTINHTNLTLKHCTKLVWINEYQLCSGCHISADIVVTFWKLKLLLTSKRTQIKIQTKDDLLSFTKHASYYPFILKIFVTDKYLFSSKGWK